MWLSRILLNIHRLRLVTITNKIEFRPIESYLKMGRKIILYNAGNRNRDGEYHAPGTTNVGYTYTSTALALIIEDLPQARYLRISDDHVAIYHPYISGNHQEDIRYISHATYNTLEVIEAVIMKMDGTDISNNFHEDVYRILREWYFNEYESQSALLRRCMNNNTL
jgi:hypothetical protein